MSSLAWSCHPQQEAILNWSSTTNLGEQDLDMLADNHLTLTELSLQGPSSAVLEKINQMLNPQTQLYRKPDQHRIQREEYEHSLTLS